MIGFILRGKQRDQRGVAPADCWNWWNWCKWGLMEYIWKGSFPGWLVGLVVPVQYIFLHALAALVSPVQNIIFPAAQKPGLWAGSRAGSPVSVSLGGKSDCCSWSLLTFSLYFSTGMNRGPPPGRRRRPGLSSWHTWWRGSSHSALSGVQRTAHPTNHRQQFDVVAVFVNLSEKF